MVVAREASRRYDRGCGCRDSSMQGSVIERWLQGQLQANMIVEVVAGTSPGHHDKESDCRNNSRTA